MPGRRNWRDARGTHTLLLGADDKGIELHTLAPNVFIGGGGAPVLVTYGQFASLLLDSVARLPEVGGPASGKRLGTHRCSDGYALLRPPPSKADPFSLHWGPCTIYLRYSASETINAARELAREELRRAVDPAKREEEPLFVTGDGAAWRHIELAAIFHSLIVATRGEERAKQVSMHSWRVYLACALLSQGASFATIQAMLRWRSEDALRIYARMNDFKYADWLTSAQGATISSVRTTTSATDALSRAPDPGTLAGAMRDAADAQAAGSAEAGFHDVWRTRAADALDVAVRTARESDDQPEVDAYGSLEGLVGGVSTLILEAERADAEDAREVLT